MSVISHFSYLQEGGGRASPPVSRPPSLTLAPRFTLPSPGTNKLLAPDFYIHNNFENFLWRGSFLRRLFIHQTSLSLPPLAPSPLTSIYHNESYNHNCTSALVRLAPRRKTARADGRGRRVRCGPSARPRAGEAGGGGCGCAGHGLGEGGLQENKLE